MSSCSKSYSLTVNSVVPGQYWKFEEATDTDRIDAVQGKHLVPNNAGGSSVQAAGKILFGAMMSTNAGGSCELGEAVGDGLNYVPGDGVTLAGWFNAPSIPIAGDSVEITIQNSGGVTRKAGLVGTAGFGGTGFGIYTTYAGGGTTFASLPAPAAGWHFFVLEYVPALVRWRLEVDRSGVFATFLRADPGVAQFRVLILSNSGTDPLAWAFDEVAFFASTLTDAQKDFLYNGGAGRTYPF